MTLREQGVLVSNVTGGISLDCGRQPVLSSAIISIALRFALAFCSKSYRFRAFGSFPFAGYNQIHLTNHVNVQQEIHTFLSP